MGQRRNRFSLTLMALEFFVLVSGKRTTFAKLNIVCHDAEIETVDGVEGLIKRTLNYLVEINEIYVAPRLG